MTRRLLFVLLGFAAVSGLAAEETCRNIATAEILTNFDGSYDVKIEDVFLYPIRPDFLLEARATVNFTDRFTRVMLQPGFVAVFVPGFYLETVYGVALDDKTQLSQEGFFELTWETERTILAGGGKFGYFHADNSWFILPSAYGMIRFFDLWAVRLKYLGSVNSAEEVTHGGILENRFYWSKKVETDLLTAGSWLVEPTVAFTWEMGFRAVFNITPEIALKYYAGVLGNSEEATGILNILSLDIKW